MPNHYPYLPPSELQGSAARCHPVAIVGAGPVGLTLALTLARQGVPAVLLEDEDRVCTGSRALGMSRRTLEIWDALGAVDPIVAHGRPWDGGRSFLRDQEVLRFRMPDNARLKFRPMLNLQQYHTEQYLIDALMQRPDIDLRWQHQLQGVRESKEHVELQVGTPDGSYTLRARHVVACDGARSSVRDALGLRLQGSTHDASYLIADIQLKSDSPMERRCWFNPPSNPGSTVLMHGQPDGVWRLDYQLQPGEDHEAAQQPERVKALIAQHLAYVGEHGDWSLVWTSVYRAHSRSLDNFCHGRVFFASDAAHLMPIFGVRGLNSGVEDAWNLGWKLAFVHQGLAGDALLQSYSAERRQVFLDNAALADRNALFMTPPSPGVRMLRDAVLELAPSRSEMADIINPRQASYVPLRDSPLSTPELPHSFASGPEVGNVVQNLLLHGSNDARPAWLQERMGLGFTGLLFLGDGDDAAFSSPAWDELCRRFPLRILLVAMRPVPAGSRETMPDPDGVLHAEFGASRGSFYLVRPDHNVAGRWKVADPAIIEAAVSQALSASTPEDRPISEPAVERSPAEQVYRVLGAALSGADEAANAKSLARLAMLLALEIGDPQVVARLVSASNPEVRTEGVTV